MDVTISVLFFVWQIGTRNEQKWSEWISFSVLLRSAIEYMFRLYIESDTLNKYAHQKAKKETMDSDLTPFLVRKQGIWYFSLTKRMME